MARRAEVTGGGTGWPIATGLGGATASLSTPVFDPISRHVFFTDSDNGGHGYSTTRSFRPSGDQHVLFAPGLSVAAPVIVDMANQRIYAFSPNPDRTAAVISQADTDLSPASQVIVDVGLAS